MKATQLIVVVFATTVGFGAVAQEATPDTWMNVASAKSRDSVRHELGQARDDGSLTLSSSEAYSFGIERATKTRAEVHAELVIAKASGELASLNAEASSFDLPVQPVIVQAKSGR